MDLATNNVDQLLLNNVSASLQLGNSATNFDAIEEIQNSITRSRGDIIEDIVQWALDQNIPNTNFDKFLNILRKHKFFEHLPASCRTLVSPGIYYHFGMADNINKQKLNSLQIKHISERLVSFRNSVP